MNKTCGTTEPGTRNLLTHAPWVRKGQVSSINNLYRMQAIFFLGGYTYVRAMKLRSEVVLRLNGGWMAVQACKMLYLGEWGGAITMEKKNHRGYLQTKKIHTYITRKDNHKGLRKIYLERLECKKKNNKIK